jgi:PAS domain S-box-containing protein
MESFGRRKEDEFLQESPLLLGIVTSEMKLKNINSSWERALGYRRDMLLDKSLTRLVDQNEHAKVLTLLNTRLAAVESAPIEFSLRCKDGSYKCFAWERRPGRDGEGVFIAGRDITARKMMETTANLQKYLQSRKP